MKKLLVSQLTLLCIAFSACAQIPDSSSNQVAVSDTLTAEKIIKTEKEWKSLLNPEQFYILREKGTERAFTGAFWNDKSNCTYVCAGCEQELFDSDTKFKSGTGWPSFYEPIAEGNIAEHKDATYGMIRTEVTCSRCDGHLGHVFSDGPAPTGLRYCINSASLKKVEK